MSKKKPLKIEFAPSTAIDSLQPYVNEVLDAIADVFEQPHAREALTTDWSAIWCFMESAPTGEMVPDANPRHHGKLVEVVTHDTPRNRELVTKLAARLGVPVSLGDHLYEVAIRMRDK